MNPDLKFDNGQTLIEGLNDIVNSCSPYPKKNFSFTHRLDWLSYSENGKDVDNFITQMTTILSDVLLKLEYPNPNISIDQAEQYGETLTEEDVKEVYAKFKSAGGENLLWGAGGNTDAIAYANKAMVFPNLETEEPLSPSKVAAFVKAKYTQIDVQIDFPGIFATFKKMYPTASDRLTSFTRYAINNKPVNAWTFTYPAYMPEWYDATTDILPDGSTMFDHFVSLAEQYNPNTLTGA